MSSILQAIHWPHVRTIQTGKFYEFGYDHAAAVRSFHKTFLEYHPSPLRTLPCLAQELGVSEIYVKDESTRFALNSFKSLGGSYCLGKILSARLGKDISDTTCRELASEEVKRQLGNIIFVTATDGNHGRGIAWAARKLGQKAVVYMPKGSSAERLVNIRNEGAFAKITPFNYDAAVQYAAQQARENDWILVQDTAWDGYEKIPSWIMQGYTTMGHEIIEQLGKTKPTHIFLQAGVGSMAGAMAAFFTDYYGYEKRPVITVVEPNAANCVFQTAKADDGELHSVQGSLKTIMAGLACGVPSTIGWNLLKDCADNFISIPEYVSAEGMRILGAPFGDDPRIISGESGASCFGLVTEVLRRHELATLKDALGISSSSKILCISTEGNTDRQNYRKIMWDGAYQAELNDFLLQLMTVNHTET